MHKSTYFKPHFKIHLRCSLTFWNVHHSIGM